MSDAKHAWKPLCPSQDQVPVVEAHWAQPADVCSPASVDPTIGCDARGASTPLQMSRKKPEMNARLDSGDILNTCS